MIYVKLIIVFIFGCITIKELKYKKKIVILDKKTVIQSIAVLLCIAILVFITYRYGKDIVDYLLCIMGITELLSSWIVQGISEEGFIRTYRGKELIQWKKIKKVKIVNKKSIKITFYGDFMESSLIFNKSDYNKVMDILEKNISSKIM